MMFVIIFFVLAVSIAVIAAIGESGGFHLPESKYNRYKKRFKHYTDGGHKYQPLDYETFISTYDLCKGKIYIEYDSDDKVITAITYKIKPRDISYFILFSKKDYNKVLRWYRNKLKNSNTGENKDPVSYDVLSDIQKVVNNKLLESQKQIQEATYEYYNIVERIKDQAEGEKHEIKLTL